MSAERANSIAMQRLTRDESMTDSKRGGEVSISGERLVGCEMRLAAVDVAGMRGAAGLLRWSF